MADTMPTLMVAPHAIRWKHLSPIYSFVDRYAVEYPRLHKSAIFHLDALKANIMDKHFEYHMSRLSHTISEYGKSYPTDAMRHSVRLALYSLKQYDEEVNLILHDKVTKHLAAKKKIENDKKRAEAKKMRQLDKQAKDLDQAKQPLEASLREKVMEEDGWGGLLDETKELKAGAASKAKEEYEEWFGLREDKMKELDEKWEKYNQKAKKLRYQKEMEEDAGLEEFVVRKVKVEVIKEEESGEAKEDGCVEASSLVDGGLKAPEVTAKVLAGGASGNEGYACVIF